MAHVETHPVMFPGGVHNGSLAAIAPLAQHGLRLSGQDPSDYGTWEDLMMSHRPENQMELSAESGDPQRDRDLVQIAKHMIWGGRNLWPGKQLTPESFNPAANYLRVAEGLPQEGPVQMPTEKAQQVQRPPYLQQVSASVMSEGSMQNESMIKEAPGNKHLPGASDKRQRQYEHIKQQYLDDGKSEEEAKELAARTVNKQRAEHGETKEGKDDEKWIQKAVKRPGQLHKDLGVPEGEKIPEEKLEEAEHSDDPKVRERAQFAENMKGLKKKKGADLDDLGGPIGIAGKPKGNENEYDNLGGPIGEAHIEQGSNDGENVAGPDFPNDHHLPDDEATKKGDEAEGDYPKKSAYDRADRAEEVEDEVDESEEEENKKKSSKIAKWQVISLGEMQQPSAVGAEPYNPVVDGPNPEGMDTDNANNSPQQEVALETWVNMAVDMFNRGESEEAVVAQLAHDGCPDPQGVVERAQQQAQQTPMSDEIGQDPFEAPVPDDGLTGQMQDVNRQPPATAKVRVAGTDLVGVEVERYEDLWGQGSVRIALDEGGTITVAPDKVESADVPAPPSASQTIQEYIDNLPAVEPTRPHIEARILNLREAKFECVRAMKSASLHEQIELDRIAIAAEEEMSALKLWLSSDESYKDVPSVSPYLGINSPALWTEPEAYVTDRIYEGRVAEAAAIWAHETPYTHEDDALEAAIIYAQNHNMSAEQINEFLGKIKEEFAGKTTPAVEKTAATNPEDSDGPAEALFI